MLSSCCDEQCFDVFAADIKEVSLAIEDFPDSFPPISTALCFVQYLGKFLLVILVSNIGIKTRLIFIWYHQRKYLDIPVSFAPKAALVDRKIHFLIPTVQYQE